MMGSVRNKVRAFYAGTEAFPATCAEAGVPANEQTGEYFRVLDPIEHLSDNRAIIRVAPIEPETRTGYIIFRWQSGETEFHWSDDD